METRPGYYYRQSAVIPYRTLDERIEILLITSRKRKRWVIPKGIVEEAMTPYDSATKEALEEAGIMGLVSTTPIGEYQYDKWGGICSVQVFPLEVKTILDDWLEADIRDRVWLTIEQAVERVDEAKLKEMLRQLPQFLNKS